MVSPLLLVLAGNEPHRDKECDPGLGTVVGIWVGPIRFRDLGQTGQTRLVSGKNVQPAPLGQTPNTSWSMDQLV